MATTLEILESALGEFSAERVQALTDQEIDALAESVAESAEAWQPPNAEGSFRTYSGGWTAKVMGESVDQLYTSLVYSPSVVVHDPIAEWFDPFRGQFDNLPGIPSAQLNPTGRPAMIVTGGEPIIFNSTGFWRRPEDDRYEVTRQELAHTAPAVGAMAPLIRSGAVVLIPELTIVKRRQRQLLAAARNDTRDEELAGLIIRLNEEGDPPPWANQVRGLAVTPTGGVPERYQLQDLVQGPAYYFHKTMAIAAELSADYLPPAGAEAALLVHRLEQLGVRLDTKSNHNVELRMTPGLYAAELPFLQELDPALMLAIRENESAFEEWRTELRNTVRLIEALPSEGATFEAEARDVLNDHLMPRALEVQKVVSLSQAMKDATRESVGTFAVSAAAIGATAVLAGPAGAGIATLVAALSTPLQWAYRVAFRPSPTGANAVLAQLVKRR